MDYLRYLAVFLAGFRPVDTGELHAAAAAGGRADFGALCEVGIAFPAGFATGDDVSCDGCKGEVGF